MKTLHVWECCFFSILLLSACEKTDLSDVSQSGGGSSTEVDPSDSTDSPGDSGDTTAVIPQDPDDGTDPGSDPPAKDPAVFHTGDTLTVNEFLDNNVSCGVYVSGYIVGCAYKKKVYLSPKDFTGKTSVLLAGSRSEKRPARMIAVYLKGKNMKNDLNLIDHPENYGKDLMLFGYRGTYQGLVGLLDCSDYSLK